LDTTVREGNGNVDGRINSFVQSPRTSRGEYCLANEITPHFRRFQKNYHYLALCVPAYGVGGEFMYEGIGVIFESSILHIQQKKYRVHTEWQWPISGVNTIVKENSSLAVEGGGPTPTPF